MTEKSLKTAGSRITRAVQYAQAMSSRMGQGNFLIFLIILRKIIYEIW